jgi:hypothetical protein
MAGHEFAPPLAEFFVVGMISVSTISNVCEWSTKVSIIFDPVTLSFDPSIPLNSF